MGEGKAHTHRVGSRSLKSKEERREDAGKGNEGKEASFPGKIVCARVTEKKKPILSVGRSKILEGPPLKFEHRPRKDCLHTHRRIPHIPARTTSS